MTEKINLSTVTYVAIHMNLVFIGIFTQRIMILFSHKRAEKSNDNSTNNIFRTRNSSIAKMEQPNQPQYQNWRKEQMTEKQLKKISPSILHFVLWLGNGNFSKGWKIYYKGVA